MPKLFDVAVYADKPIAVAADLLPLGDSAALTGGVPNNKTVTFANLAAFVAANAITLAGVAGVLTATAPTVAGTAGVGWTVTASLGVAATGTTAGGAGGALAYATGVGGAKTDTGNAAGGAGGVYTFTTGVGGATASSGANNGGVGGNVTWTLGNGGAASAGTGNGGAGGAYAYTAGTGGTSAGGTGGAGAGFTFTAGAGGNGVTGGAGGNFRVIPGAVGTGGSPTVGAFIVQQPGGVAGTDELQLFDDGTRSCLVTKQANLDIQLGFTDTSTHLGRFRWTSDTVVSRVVLQGIDGDNQGSFLVEGTPSSDGENSYIGLGKAGGNGWHLTFPANGVLAIWGQVGAVYDRPGWLQNSAGCSRVTTANVTNVTTTPAAITGLSSTLIAGRKYAGRIKIWCLEATAADGFIFDLGGGTATFSSFRATYRIFDTLSATAALTSANVTAIGTDFTGAVLTGEAYLEIDFAGVCTATTGAGTFIPRFAKASDAAGAAFTAYIDSFMLMEDVP